MVQRYWLVQIRSLSQHSEMCLDPALRDRVFDLMVQEGVGSMMKIGFWEGEEKDG